MMTKSYINFWSRNTIRYGVKILCGDDLWGTGLKIVTGIHFSPCKPCQGIFFGRGYEISIPVAEKIGIQNLSKVCSEKLMCRGSSRIFPREKSIWAVFSWTLKRIVPKMSKSDFPLDSRGKGDSGSTHVDRFLGVWYFSIRDDFESSDNKWG